MKHSQRNYAELSKVESNFKWHFITCYYYSLTLFAQVPQLFWLRLMWRMQVQCESLESKWRNRLVIACDSYLQQQTKESRDNNFWLHTLNSIWLFHLTESETQGAPGSMKNCTCVCACVCAQDLKPSTLEGRKCRAHIVSGAPPIRNRKNSVHPSSSATPAC